jgi:predicted metal-binding membrane protein
MGESTSAMLSAAILVAAGLFQFSGMKNACVSKCRSPFAFLMHEWRDGAAGALLLGLRNGSNCVGCCWALMMVLFVVGTMNLLWMALFTLLVSGEKIVPARWRLDAIVGAGFIVWGVVLATGGVL